MKSLHEEIVDKIFDAFDESTMIGAAWDCLSVNAKDKFRKKLEKIIIDTTVTHDYYSEKHQIG